jgi:flagellar assembly factor FliW
LNLTIERVTIMPELETKQIGRITYNEKDILAFPAGLPGFDQERAFLLMAVPSAKPLLLLQSVRTPELCFMTLPVLSLDPAYRLNIAPEDLRTLGFDETKQPEIGPDVLCVAIVSVSEEKSPTANLLAPLVVNFKIQKGVQAIQVDSSYSHQHPLPAPEPEVKCS